MYYLGVDVGSVSTDFVLLNKNYHVIEHLYLKTNGKPIDAIKNGLSILGQTYNDKQILSVGITGSGRSVGGYILGADLVKNEITAHAVAALNIDKNVKTIIEIGGQDSKIIVLNNGIVVDFAMNTVCAAGTGSFLDRQAERMQIPIQEFGDYALKATLPLRIAGRCSVFAESDMIHKQAMGYNTPDIVAGLCDALVRNYLTNVAKGKDIQESIFFQGGVAANIGIKASFERSLGKKLYVPAHYGVMGAIGAAILSAETKKTNTSFRGFNTCLSSFNSTSLECQDCPNCCEVVTIMQDNNTLVGRFGDKCGKWSENNISASGDK
ncbi:2-hydroxyglutaryl-CoA dehydratase [Alkalibaculum sp. M08DMB]|uniref:2-hydroxyglutaryl-CoA dehydratase n=1 Tax=Alkalibaculum sporogenes TaxID=2655001 RepID=A0A6A7K7F2_9FIRM|nr:acyl-CoA dehydratase activase [Alkalibaculum sporogenes]MPW25418.1 2-hydroxyglutaryl-CoA dehydratase [Alkalibaculum sporogenes]